MINRTQKRIHRTDLLLLLLYAAGASGDVGAPIKGKTRLQKEIFLAQKKLREAGFFTYYSWRPYKYGPYSIELYDDVEYMSYEGVLSVKKVNLGKKGIYAEFKITDKGIKEIENKLISNDFQEAHNVIQTIKKKYNDMNIVTLVELTHNLYPEYIGYTY